MDITLDLKNYNSENSIFRRTAARGIISEGEKYLFIFSKYGDYKFPGGGVEEGESLEETLLREVQEETGYHVIKASVKKYGKVVERRKGTYDDVMEMDSHYFYCQVESAVYSRNLDEYEQEYDYQVVWMTLQQAIEKNKQVTDFDTCPWVIRDTKVIEMLLNEAFLNRNIFPYIPEDMKTLIQGHTFEADSIGCSDSNVLIFDNDLVLKVERKRDESDGEYQMMQWLQKKLPVPHIVNFYTNGQTNFLLMTRLNGKMACDLDIITDRQNMARLLAKGLKKLWQVDIKDCPRTINLDYKLERALDNIDNNDVDMDNVEPETFAANGFNNPMSLYEYLNSNRPTEEYVLIHGDYCLPNVFFDNNEVSGYLDLGYCGIGDKWQDIALAVRSLRHYLEDIGKEEEYAALYKIFFNELGIEPDEQKIRYYILLDELF
jgi:kanamycin kinase/aminoglycoside 3'-phosphotransferase-3